VLAALGSMKSELLTAIGAANARTDALELQIQGLQAQQVSSVQEMQTMVTSMSASWEARSQQITGSAIVVDDGNGWHDCPEGSAGPMPEMFTDALQNNEKDTHNPCRIWIGGWPREVLSQYRKEHWEWYKTQVPQDMISNTQPSFQRTSRSYSVVFETEEAANRFKQWAFTTPSQWNDYRDRAKTFPIRVRGDIPLPARLRKSTLSCLWEPMRVKLTSKGLWNGSLRMGCSGYGSGRFQISTDADSWALFTLKTEEGQFVIVPNREELYQWKFTDAEIDFIIDIAVKNKPYL
ncbi:unnamed protein product, partial [Prorocentrum cordatum]